MRPEAIDSFPVRLWSLIAVAATGLLAGCAHNDVLVFGTSTTIGLDVQTASTQGAAPSLVLGYRREEAVWMPLLANGRDSKLALCTEHDDNTCRAQARAGPLRHAMYQSRYTPRGGTERVDAYSVFASLGANFNGDARREGVNAGGGLAQFFATGAAAVSITENPALVTALKIESPRGAEAQSDAVVAAAGLSPEVTARRAERQTNVEKIQTCAAVPATSWKVLVEGSITDAGDRTYLLRGVDAQGLLPPDQIAARLGSDDRLISRIATKANELCAAEGT